MRHTWSGSSPTLTGTWRCCNDLDRARPFVRPERGTQSLGHACTATKLSCADCDRRSRIKFTRKSERSRTFTSETASITLELGDVEPVWHVDNVYQIDRVSALNSRPTDISKFVAIEVSAV